ncbi:hypothetical protein [Bdellovibrio sp. HCB209]|uniref:hypothetical protein n=1 Tax=Bdellovibrio sp. HCB209 TaxID=3394354 RepID=UPI0039B3F769
MKLNFRFTIVVLSLLITSNSEATIIYTFGGLKSASKNDFAAHIDKKDRDIYLEADVDGDGSIDGINMVFGRSIKDKKDMSQVYLTSSKLRKRIPLKDYPLKKGRIDMSMKVKNKGDEGISTRKYFSSDDPKVVAKYKDSVVIEVSYKNYWCTIGYFFVDGEMKSEEACD